MEMETSCKLLNFNGPNQKLCNVSVSCMSPNFFSRCGQSFPISFKISISFLHIVCLNCKSKKKKNVKNVKNKSLQILIIHKYFIYFNTYNLTTTECVQFENKYSFLLSVASNCRNIYDSVYKKISWFFLLVNGGTHVHAINLVRIFTDF
jgi:hypothetical protein